MISPLIPNCRVTQFGKRVGIVWAIILLLTLVGHLMIGLLR